MVQLLDGLRLAVRRRRGRSLFAVFVVALALIIGLSTAVQSLLSVPTSVPRPQELRPLPEPLRTHVQNERFDVVTSVRGLPLGVRDALQKLFGSATFDITDPAAEFGHPPLPSRRLVAAGCSTDHCLVYYERGGAAHTWQVALFHWTPAGTRFEWGASAPGAMASIDDVRKGVLSRAINRPNSIW